MSSRSLTNTAARRTRFKLESLKEQGSAYQVITALESERPDLKMEIRPNLAGENTIIPKDEDSVAILRHLAEEKGNKVVLLDPKFRRFKGS